MSEGRDELSSPGWVDDVPEGETDEDWLESRQIDGSVVRTPPLVGSLLAHPGSKADVGPGGTLAAGELYPCVETRRLGPDGGDTLGDLVEGVLLLPGGNGGDGGASAEGFYGYVGQVHASTMPDAGPSRQEVLTAHPGSSIPPQEEE